MLFHHRQFLAYFECFQCVLVAIDDIRPCHFLKRRNVVQVEIYNENV